MRARSVSWLSWLPLPVAGSVSVIMVANMVDRTTLLLSICMTAMAGVLVTAIGKISVNFSGKFRKITVGVGFVGQVLIFALILMMAIIGRRYSVIFPVVIVGLLAISCYVFFFVTLKRWRHDLAGRLAAIQVAITAWGCYSELSPSRAIHKKACVNSLCINYRPSDDSRFKEQACE
jgi:hypothetical protein